MVLAAGGGLLEGWGGYGQAGGPLQGYGHAAGLLHTGNAFGTFCGRAGRILALSGPSMTVTTYYEPEKSLS